MNKDKIFLLETSVEEQNKAPKVMPDKTYKKVIGQRHLIKRL